MRQAEVYDLFIIGGGELTEVELPGMRPVEAYQYVSVNNMI